MICLGIESTAHTFSVGVVNGEGMVLSVVSDTFIPDEGGLTPQKVVEHHFQLFKKVIDESLVGANISLKDIDLISFSQGPGLGGAITIGAHVARSLSLSLKVPLVGVNHCIAHIEIGRVLCKVDDPITLYVSGGNTIVSAFESGRYQIFGETLDIAVGNMLDKVARLLNIPHPGGPVLEKIAKKGKQYIELPYIVKGMDLSYSGLYSAIKKKLRKITDFESQYVYDLVYSLQETAFAMLAEVFERAIAHTEKKEILLTGGVAANKRLQEMIEYVSKEHNATFHVVPRNVSGDNGAMIAWSGIVQYQTLGQMDVMDTKINTKWRMDEINAVWRSKSPHSTLKPSECQEETLIKDENILDEIGLSEGIIIRKGAEAALIKGKLFSRDILIKYRHAKNYRHPEIDKKIRERRTIIEGRTLMNLQANGVPVPPLYEINPSKATIVMKYIHGKRMKDMIEILNQKENEEIFFKIGQIVSKIHKNNRVHGDITTSNILITDKGEIFIIDFGLTNHTTNYEDFAVDLHLFKRVILSTHGKYFNFLFPKFLDGYQKEMRTKGKIVIEMIDKIELRGRYIPKDKRRIT